MTLAAVAVFAGAACTSNGGGAPPSNHPTSGPTADATTQPSLQPSGQSGSPTPKLLGLNTGPAPWPPETKFLPQRLRALGLPPLAPEITRVHFHLNLVVTVEGRQVPVPVGVGIDFRRGLLAEIHTHAGRGTIHVEAARPQTFTLGMVFGVWGVRFTPSCIGGYCDDGTNSIRVFLDGQPYRGDPTQLQLANEQVVVVTYGTEQQLPNPMPARFVYEGRPKPA